MKISSIVAQEILDSRGNPTVESVTVLENGAVGWAAVPSGASTGKYEAVELRDEDPKRFDGDGVLKAVENVNTKIAQLLKDRDAADQRAVDQLMIELDGTANKASLGANAILSVSLSVARAAAASEKKPLYAYLTKLNPDFHDTYMMPIPLMNIMNGGRHANWTTDFQEFTVIPVGATTMKDAVIMGAQVYGKLREHLKTNGYSISVGDEGGFAPEVRSNREPLAYIKSAVDNSGYVFGRDILLGLDVAASEFYRNGVYAVRREGADFTSKQLAAYYLELMKQYPLVIVEDGFDQDDWESFSALTAEVGTKALVVGDDLYVTNLKLLQKGIETKASNAILIKLNQIGTITETVDAMLLARQNHMATIVSHRSGETEDPFIADFAVAMGAGFIKTGAPARSERTVKYNRLMAIERELSGKSTYMKFPFPVSS